MKTSTLVGGTAAGVAAADGCGDALCGDGAGGDEVGRVGRGGTACIGGGTWPCCGELETAPGWVVAVVDDPPAPHATSDAAAATTPSACAHLLTDHVPSDRASVERAEKPDAANTS